MTIQQLLDMSKDELRKKTGGMCISEFDFTTAPAHLRAVAFVATKMKL